jgi:hypothetical protein
LAPVVTLSRPEGRNVTPVAVSATSVTSSRFVESLPRPDVFPRRRRTERFALNFVVSSACPTSG